MSFQIRTLQHDVQANSNNYSTLQTVVTDNSDDITTLQTDVVNNSDAIILIQTDVKDNSDDITVIQTDVKDNSDDITLIQTDVKDNSDDITLIQTDVKDNSDDITLIQTDVKDNSDDITTLQTDVKDNSDDITALQAVAPCMIRRKSGTQSIPFNVETTIDYDTELVNQDPIVLTEAAGVITVNQTGIYLINAELYFAGGATSTFRSLRFTHSGAGTEANFRWGYVSTYNVAGKDIRMVSSAVIPITSGDTIQIQCGHSEPVSLNVGNVVDANKNEMSIIKLS